MKNFFIIAFITLYSFAGKAEVDTKENKSVGASEFMTEWCHVQVDCDGDGLADYWGDVNCIYEDDLRQQYENSCTGPEIPGGLPR